MQTMDVIYFQDSDTKNRLSLADLNIRRPSAVLLDISQVSWNSYCNLNTTTVLICKSQALFINAFMILSLPNTKQPTFLQGITFKGHLYGTRNIYIIQKAFYTLTNSMQTNLPLWYYQRCTLH